MRSATLARCPRMAPIKAMPSPLMTWRIRPWPPQQQVRGFVSTCVEINQCVACAVEQVVDSYSLVAWHDATLGVRPVGTCGACCCGGEGCCYTTITGPGTAWVQSMPWELYRRHMGVVVQLDKNGNVKGVS